MIAIEQELSLLARFCHLLNDEQHFLMSGQTTPLVALAEEKTHLANQLLQQCAHRHALLEIPPSPLEAERLEYLKTRASEAEQINKTNGELIQIRLRHNQQALNILQQASHQATLYGPDGRTHTSLTGRPLAQG